MILSKYFKCLRNLKNSNHLNGRRNKSTTITSSGTVKSVLSDVYISDNTLPDFVWEKTKQFPDLVALECGVTGRNYKYNDLYTKTRNFANALRSKLNLESGDVIALVLPNIPEFPICLLGALQAGLTVTTINPCYTSHEITRQLLDSKAKSLITIPDLLETSTKAIMDSKSPISLISIGNKNGDRVINFFELCEIKSDQMPIVNDVRNTDVAILPYSSGTTGMPKGVQLTHRNMVANLSQLSHPKNDILKSYSGEQENLPCILPMFHIYGLCVITLCPLLFGKKIVTLPKFVPEQFVGMLEKHRPSLLFVAPPIVQFLTNNANVRSDLLPRVRYLTSGAAPLGVNESEKFTKKFGNKIRLTQGYGMTETSPIVTLSPTWEKDIIFSSIGVPIANTECKVIDLETKEICGPNRCGELLVRGPQVMLGYHNNEKATKETLDEDGWLRTGDVMYYDQDGNFFVSDRIKELIKVKGFQVAPAELEDILCSHESVLDAAVIGIPHEKSGEVPKAFIVKKNGCTITEGDLKEFVKIKVAAYKQLEGGIVFVDAIPKSASGKILRRELKSLR